MKPKCWLVAIAVVSVIILVPLWMAESEFQSLLKSAEQTINQEPIVQTTSGRIYKPPFRIDLDNVPMQFKILSKAPELQIQLFRRDNRGSLLSKIFKSTLATLIVGIPLLIFGFVFIVALLSFIGYFFAGLIGNLDFGELFTCLMATLLTGFLTLVCISAILSPFGSESFRELRASGESLADVSESRRDAIPSSTIQYFNVTVCYTASKSGDSSSYTLDVVTNQPFNPGRLHNASDCSKFAKYQNNYKGTELYNSQSVDRVMWLGAILADFYNTQLQINRERGEVLSD